MIISRRKLLKLSGGILATAPFVQLQQVAYAESLSAVDPVITKIDYPLGRAIHGAIIRVIPSVKGKVVKRIKQNAVIALEGQTLIEGTKCQFVQTTDGYVHSASILPSLDTVNKPVEKH